ncbi:MAG: AAA family ATPase [Azospirillum sp.]|nr:AAA family ATPase [Azospirillum sp.]
MVLTTHPGGLVEARMRYEQEPAPPLLVIETTETGDELTGRIDALAEVCTAETNLILLGRTNDVELYRTLTRMGVGDYVVLPAPPGRLIESILELYEEPGKKPTGRVIAFIGAKGGCGSSQLAHNTGYTLTGLADCDVLIVDFDLPFGCADLTFNVETPHGIRNLLADPERADEVSLQRFTAKYGERLALLAAPCSLDGELGVNIQALETVVGALKQQAKYVILDLPHLWQDWVRVALQLADDVVVVATPDLTSIRNARNLIDFIAVGRALDAQPVLVLNRLGAARKSEIPAKDFAQTVGVAATVTVPDDTDAFGRATTLGRMVEEVAPRSKAADAIRQLAVAVGKVEAGRKKTSFQIPFLRSKS